MADKCPETLGNEGLSGTLRFYEIFFAIRSVGSTKGIAAGGEDLYEKGSGNMYAIIREGDGRFYTSMVFGYYQSFNKKRFWIVLNKSKTALIKQPMMQQNTKYLIPMVLITDADESGWNKIGENKESVDFLPTDQLLSMIDHNSVPSELTQKCIEMDSAYIFKPTRTIHTADDIRDLEWVSGGFHDAFIADIKQNDDSLYILFDGTWGCKIEVWLEGDISYDTSGRDPEKGDPNWFGGTVTIHNGFVYLIDEEDVSVEEICSNYCWFKARTMKYRVIPD